MNRQAGGRTGNARTYLYCSTVQFAGGDVDVWPMRSSRDLYDGEDGVGSIGVGQDGRFDYVRWCLVGDEACLSEVG